MSEILKSTLDTIIRLWWIIIPVVLFYIAFKLWMEYIQGKFILSIEWTLLEVRLPAEIEKSPKAFEQVLAGLHGIQRKGNLIEKYIQGYVQLYISLELIGQNGEIHFLIYTPTRFRNLVEAQVYAQYPDAEIFETTDYALALAKDIPNDDYDLWGTELVLVKKDAYPIRTYPAFKEEITKEPMIDPLAGLTEILSHLRDGEQIWLQFLIKPVGDAWKNAGQKIVNKLISKKTEKKKGVLAKWQESFSQAVLGPGPEKEKVRELPTAMQFLSPGEREIVEAIERNIAKIGFATKIRFIYLARKEVLDKTNVAAIMGAFKQFASQNLNGFKPDAKTKTGIDYFFKKFRETWRKRRIFDRYKKRRFKKKSYVLNIEELATIYHYPSIVVRAPMMPRVEAKKGEPPVGLPV